MSEAQRSFITDEPIKKLEEDVLGRKKFTENLAKAIYNYLIKDSLVIGLHGQWGSGKTSILNLVLDKLKEEEKPPLLIRFEPWYFSGQNQLLEQFFKHLSASFINPPGKFGEKFQESSKNIGDALIKLASTLQPIKYLTPFVGIPKEIAEQFLVSTEETGKSLTGIQKDKVIDPISQKLETSKLLASLDTKVLIVIDDIDRLNKDEIRQIFQLVKALANFPNTIYLLSFDIAIVSQALEAVQAGEGLKYLEKIVQVSFEIPAPSRSNLNKYLTSHLDKIISDRIDENRFSQSYWSEIYFLSGLNLYFSNIREINRFLNIFQFEFSLLAQEVNIVDLIVFSAIKSQDNKLYNFIGKNKEIFCETGLSNNDYMALTQSILGKEEYSKQLKQKYLENKNSFGKANIVESLLTRVFPYFNKLLDKTNFSSDRSDLRKERRAAQPEIFESFFLLDIPEDQVSYSEVQKIIELKDRPLEFSQAISFYQKQGKLSQLFEAFNVYKESFYDLDKEAVILLIRAVAPFSDLDDELVVAFTPPTSTKVQFFTIALIENVTKDKKELLAFLQCLVTESMESVYLSIRLLYYCGESFGFYNREGFRNLESIEASEDGQSFKAFEESIKQRIEKIASSGSLQKYRRLAFVLYAWLKIDETSAKNFVQKLLLSKEGIIDFLAGILSYSSGADGSIPRINKNFVGDFTNNADLTRKVREIQEDYSFFNSLSEKSQLAVNVFLTEAID